MRALATVAFVVCVACVAACASPPPVRSDVRARSAAALPTQPPAALREPACRESKPLFSPVDASSLTKPASVDVAWIDRPFGDPGELVAAGIDGVVELLIEVTAEGRPRCVRVAKSSGSAQLDTFAIVTASDYRFVPAMAGGQNADSVFAYTFSLKLVRRDQADRDMSSAVSFKALERPRASSSRCTPRRRSPSSR